MNEIETPLTHATVAETAYLASDSSKIIKKYAIEDPYLNKLGTELEDAGNKMEKSIATSRKKAFTEKLAEADDKRDAAFNALKLFIRGYIRWNIEAYAIRP